MAKVQEAAGAVAARPAEVLTGVSGSVVLLLQAFGADITSDQLAAILGVVGWLPAIITLLVSTVRSLRAGRRVGG